MSTVRTEQSTGGADQPESGIRLATGRANTEWLLAQADDASVVSKRLDNYEALVTRVGDVFGDELRASRWLSRANQDFGGETPLQVARENDYQVSVLEPVLIRIEHGIDF